MAYLRNLVKISKLEDPMVILRAEGTSIDSSQNLLRGAEILNGVEIKFAYVVNDGCSEISVEGINYETAKRIFSKKSLRYVDSPIRLI